MIVQNVHCEHCGRKIVKHYVRAACGRCSAVHGKCPACSETRTVTQIRELVGARPGEDVVALVRQLVWYGRIQRESEPKPCDTSVLQTGLERATG